MDEDYLEWLYYANRCNCAEEYKKMTGENLDILDERIAKLEAKIKEYKDKIKELEEN